MSILRVVLLPLLIGCADHEPGDHGDAGSTESGPYVVPADDDILPELNEGALAAGIEEALIELLAFDLAPITAGYQAVMSEAEDGCPIWASSDGTPYWTASCTTSGGASFDGYGASIDYSELASEDGLTYTGHLFNSVSEVTTADGETFIGGGIAYAIHGTNGAGYTVSNIGTTTGFDWTGPEAEESWLRSDTALDFDATQVTAEGYQFFAVQGLIAGLDTVQAVVFNEFTAVDHAGRIEGCEREPHGSVAILTLDGDWLDLEFDGIDGDGQVDPQVGCDGCTAAWFEGRPLGEVCIDAAAAYDWAL